MARLASRTRLTALASALVIAYAATTLAALLSLLEPVALAEQGAMDWRFLFRGPVGEKPTDIALVTVDEEADLPYWAPVPREHLAQVINSLSAAGARLIGLDFYLGSSSFDTHGDSLLREAIGNAGNVIPVSYLEWDGEELGEHLPMPFFRDVALDYGYATFYTGTAVESVNDGRVAMNIAGKHALSLAGCLYAHATGLDTDQIRQLDWSRRHEGLPGADDDYERVIDYNGPPFQYYRGLDSEMAGGIAAFHSHQVASLPAALTQRFFKDRIVLVGSGLADAPDIYRTPFFSQQYGFVRTFGVEIHAQFLHTLFSDDPLERSGFFFTAVIALVAAFLAALASVRLRPYLAFPLVLVDMVLLWVLAFYLFQVQQIAIPLVTPTIGCALAALLGLMYVGSTDGRKRNEARDRFAPMVGPSQLTQILEQPDSWTTDGEERLVSVLWVRLQPLDGDSPGRSARETMLFHQEYWSRVSTLIHKHEGAVFRYEEDGLAAVFGAPLSIRDHGPRSVMAAIDVMEGWMASSKESRVAGGRLAVGVDTGRCFTGETAGETRSAYRVLGRPVHGARALAEGQQGQGRILISPELKSMVEDQVELSGPKSDGESGYQVTGRLSAPAIGAADQPPNPFWKYLGLERGEDDPMADRLLSQLALFSDFSSRDIKHIRPLLYRRQFATREPIFHQGEVGSGMYVILHGTVDIVQESEDGGPTQLLQRLGEGDFFGELALLSDLHRAATAVAYEPCELLVLFQADLYDLIEREPELGVRLIRSLSRILGERLIQVNEELAKRSAPGAGEGSEP
ncbi:CHASE2 domain-containing protein [Candidatus Latescibacterota bacterium]